MLSCNNEQHWMHYQPVRLDAGPDIVERLPQWVRNANLLLVTTAGTSRRGLTDRVRKLFDGERIEIVDNVDANPDLDGLDTMRSALLDRVPSVIVAVGGGSVLDTAKVLGATLKIKDERLLARMFRHGEKLEFTENIPVIAIPTTAGSGAEVTPFATVWDKARKRKFSLAGDFMYAQCALLDPLLTLSLPTNETLYGGLDAVAHAVESLWNVNRTPVSEALAAHALELACEALPAVLEKPGDVVLREKMQQAATLAGMAISQTRTAIAHAVSYPLTLHYGVPHGLACGFMLPALIRRQYARQDIPEPLKSLLNQTAVMLGDLGVSAKLEQYVAKEQAIARVPEMLDPERANNYSLPIEPNQLVDLLNEALTP